MAVSLGTNLTGLFCTDTLAGESCIVDGGAIDWEKLRPESCRGYIVYGECHEYSWFVLGCSRKFQQSLSMVRESLVRLDVRVTYNGLQRAYRGTRFRRWDKIHFP